MGIFKNLKSRGEPNALKALNEYLKFNVRLTEAKTCFDFINDCLQNDRYPKIYWKSLRRNKVYPNSRSLKRDALNQLDSLKIHISEIERNLSQRKFAIEDLPKDLLLDFLDYVDKVSLSRAEKRKVKLVKSLESQNPERNFPPNPYRYVHNFSSVVLDKLQLEALSLGFKFCDQGLKINQLDTNIQFENLFLQTKDLIPSSDDELARFKTTLVDCCQQYKNSSYSGKSLMTKEHREALKKLRNDENIIISRPDKGDGVVLMNKCDYVDKMNLHLIDETKFQKLYNSKDLDEKAEKQLSDTLKELRKSGVISEAAYNSLKPTGSNTSRLYGLPKVHKPGLPLRPVLDMSNSTYHGVAKWLVSLLQPLHKKLVNHSVKDVFDFISKIHDITVSGKKMLSLDVESLFTNVPLMETVDFICQQIIAQQLDIGIPVTKLKELLLRCTMNVHFTFNNLYYRQIDGIAMGSPLGPILADFFLAKLENGPLNQVIEKMDCYFRYVDDTFIIIDEKADKNELLLKFNDVHPSLIFTCEEEKDDKLHFLDVQLSKRGDGSLKRDVYRKPTSVGQYTHFFSFVPMRYKINLVRCLTYRGKKICTEDTIENELVYIKNTLVQMGYPMRFIKKHMNTVFNKVKTTTVNKKQLFLKLQFNGDAASEVLNLRLSRAIRRTYTAATLCLSFSSRRILNAQAKDKLPSCATSMCIYKFSCSCGESYIGRTTRQLNKRINEHLPSWFGKGQTKTIRSSILSHLIDSGHQVDRRSAFKVIYRIPPNHSKGIRTRLLHIAEAMGIREDNPSLCVQKKFVLPLSLPWPR